MADGNYKVSLGVDLRVNEIRERINQYNANSNNAKLRLGVRLDTKGLAEQIRAINYKTPVKLAIKFDTKSVQSQISNIRRQIQQLGNIRINLGGSGIGGGTGRQDIQTVRIARSVDDVTRAYRELLSLQSRIGSKQQAVAKLDTSKNQQEILELSNQVDKLYARYQRLHTLFNGQFSSVQTDRLNRGFEITAEKLEVIKSKALDAKSSLDRMGASGTKAGAANSVKQTANELTIAFNKLRNISQNIGVIKSKLAGGLNTSKDVQQIKVLEAQLQSLTTQYHNTVAKIKGKGDLSTAQWQTIQHQIDNTKLKLDQLSAKVVDAKNKLANNIKLKLSDGTFANDISNIQAKFNGLSMKSDTLRAGIDRVKLAIKDMQTAANSGNVDALTSAYQRYQVTLKSVENQLRINKNIEQQANNAESLKQSRNAFLLETNNWLQKNSAAAAQFGGRIKELQAQVNNCDKASLARLRAEFSNIKQEAALAGKTTQTFGDRLRMQFQRYSAYFSVASVIMYSVQALRSMFEQVKAIDSAMVELKKVTNETNESYNEFLTNAAARSKEIGTTIDGLVQSTAGFARLGYGFEESQKLAEVANIYAVVGDEVEGVEGATKSLISTMAAFKEQQNGIANEDFAMDIIDKFNEIGNNFAISSGGVGDALQRSASSLAAANNTLDESIALITAANTVVQNPEVVGTAFKTMSMRIRGAKSELEEAGLETEGMVESTAKLRQEILALSGVDIMEDNDTFKSTYKILDELAVKWKDLTDIQQASITELIAGKRQGNVVSSLMTNFDTAREALETSANSEGSAMAEHEKWMQSLEAGLNRVKAAWQSLSQSFLKSDFLKSLLKSVESLTSGFGSLIDTFGTLPTILTLLTGGKFLISGKGFFKPVIDEATGAAKGITTIFGQAANNVKTSLSGINVNNGFNKTLSQDDITAVRNYSNAVYNQGVPAAKAFATHMGGASNAAKAYAQNTNGATISVNGFVQSQQAAEVSTLAQNKSLGSAKVLMQEYHSGCKATGMAQTDFANAVKQTNPQLAAAMTSTNGATAGMFKYTMSLVGAKVASIALKAVTMALNMALTMGVSFIVSELISAITKWINAEEELAERVDEVTSKFKEQHNELTKGASSFKTLASRHAELSKGVDESGKNISLTADEYLEYQDVVNSIADQIPSLVAGYDSQGNAILNLKDNVEGLTSTYDKLIRTYESLIKAQNNEVLKKENADSIEDDFKNVIDNANSRSDGVWGTKSNLEDVDNLNEILNSADFGEKALEIQNRYDGTIGHIANALKNLGFEQDYGETYADFIARAFTENKEEIERHIDDFYADLEAETEGMKSLAQAAISNAFDLSDSDFYGMNDTLKNVARQAVNSFDYEFFAGLIEDGKSVEEYVNNMLKQLNALSGGDVDSIEAAFNLQTKFNNGDVSYGEFINGLEDAGKLIDTLNLSDDIKSQLKLSLGLNEEGLVEEYEALINRLTDTSKDNISKGNIIGLGVEEAKKFVDSLSAEELSVVTDIIPELDANATAQQIQAAIDREMAVRGLFFDLNLEVETASIDAFNTALQESVSAAGLSADSIAALKGRYADLESEGYNLSDMFEETSNGIHLNRKAVRELEKAYAEQKQNEITEDVNALKKEYNLLTQDINKCNDASERASLYVQRDAVLQQINDAATLAAQYEGLTSAYNDWLAAEESGQERDMYEKLIEGFENVDDEISRGWLDDGTIEFLELLTGRDLTTAPIEDLKQAYADLDKQIGKSGYSIRDFFTVNDDGDSTNTGVYNFLETIESLGGKYKDSIKRKDGRIVGFDFKIAGGDEAIAKALGISEELVEIMLRASDDAGFVVNLEGAWTQLADLKTEAESARDKLIDLKKNGLDKLKDFDVNFDLNAEGKDLLAEQEKAVNLLEKFKKNGKIDLTMDGAQQALDIAEYLTIRLDDLTEPRYMQVDASILDDNLKEPVEKMQEFERLSKQKHLLSLTGDTKGLEEVNAEMDEIAEYLYQLDDEEVKTKLDIEGLDTDEIKKKLEAGEIELPAELNLDVKMSDDLKDMRLMMMNQLGLVSDAEVKLKVGYDVDDSVVNELTEEEKEIMVKYLADGGDIEKFDEWLSKRKNIEIIAETFGIEDVDDLVLKLESIKGLDGTTIQAIAEAIGKGDVEALQSTIEGLDGNIVQAIAEALGYGDVETLKNAINGMQGNTVDAVVNTDGQSEKIDTLQSSIFGLVGTSVDVVVNFVKSGFDKVKNWLSGGEEGGSGLSGTAHAYGTSGKAFKQGDWRTKKTENALVGELGREIVVTPNNRWHTVGDNGAEFVNIPRGSIIFNHRQTEELFANGKVTSGGGRGKAFANGTAFAFGSSGIGGGLGKIIHSVTVDGTSGKAKTKTETKVVASSGDGGALDKNSDSASKKSGGGSSSKDEFEESFDWIETAISRIERAIDQLDQKANNVYKSWSDRNYALTQEIGKVREEIELQEDAAQRYLQEANSVGLDSSYAEKVRNGTIDIEDFKGEDDEKLVEKIKDYQKWYELYLSCIDAAEELRETEAKLYAQRVENVQTQYEGILSVIEHEKNVLDEYIAQSEANAQLISVNYYNALAKNERENLSKLEEQKVKMLAEMQAAMDSGTITKESEAWYDMVASIDEVTLAIAESNTQLIEYQQTIQQLSWERFDLLQEKISSVVEETEFLIELMSSDKLYDDNGKLTNSGMATMGQHGVAYNTHMYQAELASAEAERLKKELAKDPFDTELEERYREMVSLQQEHILAAQGEKEAIRDMVEEGIELELNALEEKINLYQESLDSQKD